MYFYSICQDEDVTASVRHHLTLKCNAAECTLICCAAVQWVAMHAEPKFVLKTDDDAYVSCTALVDVLRGLCHSADCKNERIYFGQEKRNGVVITEEDSKWSNLEYFQLTGLKEYVPYMLGGG